MQSNIYGLFERDVAIRSMKRYTMNKSFKSERLNTSYKQEWVLFLRRY